MALSKAAERFFSFARLRPAVAAVALAAAALPPTEAQRSPASGGVRKAPGLAVVSSLVKVRPDEPLPNGLSQIRMRALRGECELAQIAVGAADEPLTGVRARANPPPGDDVTIRLYREDLLSLAKPSGPEGKTGTWPDPLVPDRDPSDGRPRSAFPFDVAAASVRAILVEACVSAGATPGERNGSVEVTLPTGSVTIPLHLRVENASIPATSTFPTSFGFSALSAALGHFGRPGTPEEIARLDRLYRTMLLDHRISVHGGTMEPPPFQRGPDGEIRPDFAGYDREVGPFLEGKALPSGARATTTELRTHPGLRDDDERIRYWAAIAAHHESKGWSAILFDYAKDEPAKGDLPAIAARARLVKRANEKIRVLLTASLDPSLRGLVDVWTPNLNCLWVKSRPEEFCAWRAPRSAYDPLLASGNLLWWYQSCSSHGCGEGPSAAPDYFRGWPTYVIDAPGTRARSMGWLAFGGGIGGELYWDTVHAYAPNRAPGNPWSGELRSFGGNGDGTLLYPGSPARIGGDGQVPVPSLRLKQIRDGLEDLELLRLVASRPGGRALAEEVVSAVAPTPFRIRDDPAAFEEARGRLLDFLAGTPPAGPK
ncbi:DUF4091 domain-containing protein [Vulgatibacter incomptus]|uniref:Glycoside hydrolase 123 catalytic domain-containing protein n=1 Tax=Vulgatibacter incomptus TaxID=1391653 RepID=A0A0K1PCJ3_9BACT|nr:DUF4091 domain-containing protein [Vulgatibacter incomptus]AKU91217.1 hypothetical protein AKJ08_1604 [Vulgatibacter incomptus]